MCARTAGSIARSSTRSWRSSGALVLAPPKAGFYLWPETPIPDTDFAARLFAEENLTVLPGRFLSRVVDGADPGMNRIRLALVPPLDECVDAARRIRRCLDRI
jgi:N-succinyldiaminopimelate aminotransferase